MLNFFRLVAVVFGTGAKRREKRLLNWEKRRKIKKNADLFLKMKKVIVSPKFRLRAVHFNHIVYKPRPNKPFFVFPALRFIIVYIPARNYTRNKPFFLSLFFVCSVLHLHTFVCPLFTLALIFDHLNFFQVP